MTDFIHTLSDGCPVRIALKHSAKKNIILRPLAADAASVNVPKWFGRRNLQIWLAEHENLLRQTLDRWTQRPSESLSDGLNLQKCKQPRILAENGLFCALKAEWGRLKTLFRRPYPINKGRLKTV